MPSLFTAVDHPAIACYDVQKMIEWYSTHLGMRLIASNGKTPPSVIIGYDKDAKGGAMIELMPIQTQEPKPLDVPRFCPGLRHLAIRVANFDEAYAKLKAAGVTFLFEPVEAVGGGKLVSFRDLEGNELQIVQR